MSPMRVGFAEQSSEDGEGVRAGGHGHRLSGEGLGGHGGEDGGDGEDGGPLVVIRLVMMMVVMVERMVKMAC